MPLLRARLALLVLALVATAPLAHADDTVAPNANLKADGIPAVPAALAKAVERYTEFRPRFVASWRPDRPELVIATRATNTAQLFAVDKPLGALAPITRFAEPVRWGVYLAHKPDTLVFVRDSGGNEQAQLYRLDPGAAEPVQLTDPRRAHRPGPFTRDRKRILVGSVDVDSSGPRENPTEDLALLDPLDGRSTPVATLPGTGWGDYSFSFDDRRLAMVDSRSVNESYVWILDLSTGKRTRVFPREGETPARPVATDNLQFARDGDALFLSTDRDGEFARSARLDLASGKLTYFGPAQWDAESLALSPDGKTLAVVTNEAGVGVLRLYDAGTLQELPRPELPVGAVSSPTWHLDSRRLAFNLNSARSPSDVWSLDLGGARPVRWTSSSVEGLDPATFQPASPIEWKSFDGRSIGGFIVRPPARFTGPRPVLIDVHGGPEGQARPGFLGRANYFVNELGIAVVQPNVRGSTGYGKTFVALDNGRKREDSVKDIGALLDWIAAQPDLDPKRVVVAGGSYGGYMALAVATHYADRIAGTVDVVGVANFVTFLERTESYRRDLRRVEYGDERDPAMREFLAGISPVNNAGRIAKPIFVVHGRNDPRVPYTEAEQIVERVRKNGVTTWYLLAANEGHGFAKKENADYYFYALILFLRETLKIPG